jgi:hypothetical protein
MLLYDYNMHYIYDFGQYILIIFANCMKAIISNFELYNHVKFAHGHHGKTCKSIDMSSMRSKHATIIGFQPYSYLWIKS